MGKIKFSFFNFSKKILNVEKNLIMNVQANYKFFPSFIWPFLFFWQFWFLN